MKNKHLLSLLVIPFLLTGCGGSSTVKGGKIGDPVLTKEQLDAYKVSDPETFDSKVSKVGTITIPSGYLYYESDHEQLGYYIQNDAENDKVVIVSFIKGGVICEMNKFSELVAGSSVDFNYGLYSTYGIDCVVVKEVRHNEATDKDVISMAVYDALGTKLNEYKGENDDVRFTVEPLQREVPVDSLANKTATHRYVSAYYLDPKTGKTVENVFEYDEKFSKATKVDNYYDTSVLEEDSSTRKFYKEKKDEKIEYLVRSYSVYDSGSPRGRAYEVSHVEEDKTVYATYFVPSGAIRLVFDHHIIYQSFVQVDEHDLEYTVAANNVYYKVETYVIDMLEGTTKEAEFPYIIINGETLEEAGEAGQVTELAKYAVATLMPIENKLLAPNNITYVIDSSLELHDDMAHYTEVVKVGNGFVSKSTSNNAVIYNENRVPVKILSGVMPHRFAAKCVVIRSGSGRYGLIDAEGNYLINPEGNEFFKTVRVISKDVICFTGDFVTRYFNIDTLKDVKLVEDPKATYSNTELQYGFRVEQGEAVEGSKDRILFLNEVLGTYDRVPSRTLTRRGVIALNDNPRYQAVYESVRYMDEEFNIHYDIYRAELMF